MSCTGSMSSRLESGDKRLTLPNISTNTGRHPTHAESETETDPKTALTILLTALFLILNSRAKLNIRAKTIIPSVAQTESRNDGFRILYGDIKSITKTANKRDVRLSENLLKSLPPYITDIITAERIQDTENPLSTKNRAAATKENTERSLYPAPKTERINSKNKTANIRCIPLTDIT